MGMRLAFDKPTVIIKDDKTDYSFDTGIVEHISYPRDLRFSRIVSFKASLAEKVLATYRAATTNPDHSTFLKNFGKFQVANLTESVVPADKIVIELLQDLQNEVGRLSRDPIKKTNADEKAALIAAGVSAYRADKHNMSTVELMRSEAFFDQLERIVNAPRHFAGPSDFRSAVERFLVEMVQAESKLDTRGAIV
jgi:hypothetical protein